MKWIFSDQSSELFFGLAAYDEIESVVVETLSGSLLEFDGVEINNVLTIK